MRSVSGRRSRGVPRLGREGFISFGIPRLTPEKQIEALKLRLGLTSERASSLKALLDGLVGERVAGLGGAINRWYKESGYVVLEYGNRTGSVAVYLEKKGGKVVVVCGYPEIQKKFEDFFNQ